MPTNPTIKAADVRMDLRKIERMMDLEGKDQTGQSTKTTFIRRI
jgi:hypothetical protein